MNPVSLLLQDLISSPTQAEPILDCLTADQLTSIQNTLDRVKRKKLEDKHFQSQQLQNTAATSIACALAAVVTSSLQSDEPEAKRPEKASKPSADLTTTVLDGVDWLSFVYSHNRILKHYSIRTDIQTISLDDIDEQFKIDNCVYPRAKQPKEKYQGNRWAYETECNELGWKLAWLNTNEISGKRGLIQRAVDSYRNRYPSLRSRRVTRQEKLINGTLRKRKHRDSPEESPVSPLAPSDPFPESPLTLESSTIKPAHHPKTIAMDDLTTKARFRIKINVETVQLDSIPADFRRQNSLFPRAMTTPAEPLSGDRARGTEEMIYNELAWRLAWLNPRLLDNKKNLLQRAVDVYRRKFMPELQPRKNTARTSLFARSIAFSTAAAVRTSPAVVAVPTGIPLSTTALSAQNAHFDEQGQQYVVGSPAMSCVSGTTASLDFTDCFSLAEDDSSSTLNDLTTWSYPTSRSTSPPLLDDYTTNSISSSSHNTPSPPHPTSNLIHSDFYDSLNLSPVIHGELSYANLFSSSPLPSSAVQQELLVKMEEGVQDEFSGHYFDPLLF